MLSKFYNSISVICYLNWERYADDVCLKDISRPCLICKAKWTVGGFVFDNNMWLVANWWQGMLTIGSAPDPGALHLTQGSVRVVVLRFSRVSFKKLIPFHNIFHKIYTSSNTVKILPLLLLLQIDKFCKLATTRSS